MAGAAAGPRAGRTAHPDIELLESMTRRLRARPPGPAFRGRTRPPPRSGGGGPAARLGSSVDSDRQGSESVDVRHRLPPRSRRPRGWRQGRAGAGLAEAEGVAGEGYARASQRGSGRRAAAPHRAPIAATAAGPGAGRPKAGGATADGGGSGGVWDGLAPAVGAPAALSSRRAPDRRARLQLPAAAAGGGCRRRLPAAAGWRRPSARQPQLCLPGAGAEEASKACRGPTAGGAPHAGVGQAGRALPARGC